MTLKDLSHDTNSVIRLVGMAVMLLLQGAALYFAISSKVDEMSRDNRRILRAENAEHLRIWTAMGRQDMFNYIEPLDPSDNIVRKVTP